MQFERVIPCDTTVTARDRYTGLALGERARSDRPYVVCNFVTSADGKATAGGRTAPLSGQADRFVFHLLRTQVDAVLAGTGTLRIERYGVLVRDERLVEIRLGEGRAEQPLAVVISRSGRIPFDIPLFADAKSRVALYCPRDTRVPDCAAAVTVHELPAQGHGLNEVLRSLRRDHEVGSLLCEGGPVLFNALLVEDLIDELFLTVAPALVGGGELAVTTGPPPADLRALRLIWALEQDAHLFLRYSRR